MLQAAGNPSESWLEIAAAARRETDPKKLLDIIERLCQALEEIRLERGGKRPNKAAAA